MTGNELRALLSALGISQMEASRRLNVDGSTVRRWLSGRSRVPAMAAAALQQLVKEGEVIRAPPEPVPLPIRAARARRRLLPLPRR